MFSAPKDNPLEAHRCGRCLINRGKILLKLKDLDESERALLLHYYYEAGGICDECPFLAKENIPSDLLVERKAHEYKSRLS